MKFFINLILVVMTIPAWGNTTEKKSPPDWCAYYPNIRDEKRPPSYPRNEVKTFSFDLIGKVLPICGRLDEVFAYADFTLTQKIETLPLCLQTFTIPITNQEGEYQSNQKFFKVIEEKDEKLLLESCSGNKIWMKKADASTPLVLHYKGNTHLLEFQNYLSAKDSTEVKSQLHEVSLDWCRRVKVLYKFPKDFVDFHFERLSIEATKGGGTLEVSECEEYGC